MPHEHLDDEPAGTSTSSGWPEAASQIVLWICLTVAFIAMTRCIADCEVAGHQAQAEHK